MYAHIKLCLKKYFGCGIKMEFTLSIVTVLLLFSAIAGISQGAEVVAEETEGDFGFDGAGYRQGPVFLKEPEDSYYVIKNRPAVITCKASGAVHISFKCANSFIKQPHLTTVMSVDPITQKDIVETSITVLKEDVEDYYGSDEYWCECYASNQPPGTPGAIVVKSDKRGLVEQAYLRRVFADSPHTTRVEVKGQTLLRCLPPDGKPLPEVFWQKEGIEIDVQSDINFIIASEGNLIINQARFSDAGNYTCGARNMVRAVFSQTVQLVVYGYAATWCL